MHGNNYSSRRVCNGARSRTAEDDTKSMRHDTHTFPKRKCGITLARVDGRWEEGRKNDSTSNNLTQETNSSEPAHSLDLPFVFFRFHFIIFLFCCFVFAFAFFVVAVARSLFGGERALVLRILLWFRFVRPKRWTWIMMRCRSFYLWIEIEQRSRADTCGKRERASHRRRAFFPVSLCVYCVSIHLLELTI